MPVRLIRDQIKTSKKVNTMDPLDRWLFLCLLVTADDYGRFYADPVIVTGNCLPFDGVKPDECELMLQKLQEHHLIDLYTDGERDYLQIIDFKQRLRARKSKYPAPEGLTRIDGQVSDKCPSSARLDVVEVEVVVVDESRTRADAPIRSIETPQDLDITNEEIRKGAMIVAADLKTSIAHIGDDIRPLFLAGVTPEQVLLTIRYWRAKVGCGPDEMPYWFRAKKHFSPAVFMDDLFQAKQWDKNPAILNDSKKTIGPPPPAPNRTNDAGMYVDENEVEI